MTNRLNLPPDILRQMISQNDYRVFAGPDWPTYDQILQGHESADPNIQQEVENFVRMIEETYKAQLKHGDDLATANQKRQGQIFFNKQFHGPHCRIPWETMGINSNGDVFICLSPSWIPKFVGNLMESDDIFDILNSELALTIRNEILQGRYSFCNHRICGFFSNISPDRYHSLGPEYHPITPDARSDIMIDRIPKNLILDFDYTCNFRCPSCRTELINNNRHYVIRTQNNRIVDRIKRMIIDRIQDHTVQIRWCGGEPFISEPYLDLMSYISKNKPNSFRHVIQTNGSYLKKKSDLLERLLPSTDLIRVSFDAACADTYHQVRINGQWDQLIENVQWLRQRIDKIAPKCNLEADFVVQLANYKEISMFVNLCHTLKIDHVNWQKMWNWGTWSQDQFDRNNIYNPDHDLYNDLVYQFQTAQQPMSLT